MKITVPKEAIDKIMEQYQCSEEQASKAYLDGQDQAKLAFEEELEHQLEKNNNHSKDFHIRVYTPKEIKHHLDKFVVGQEEYKKRLSIAAAYHFSMVKYLSEHPEDKKVKRFRKKNTITAGPSGSGKTYCIEVLADLMKIPTLIVDATDYTEAGYVGKNADDMIRELIEMAPGENRKEQAKFVTTYGGLIFIDEIDKKAKEGTIGHDISREGFQRAVLKLIERKQISIENPYSPAIQLQELRNKDKNKEKKDNLISTENILFILGGSFERIANSLDKIVQQRIQRGETASDDGDSFVIKGFSSNQSQNGKKGLNNYYKNAEAEDFIKFGLLPEIVGRSPIRTFVNPLSKNNLIRIMKDTEDSILNQYELEFKIFDMEIEFADEAIEFVAEKAENMRTGARALVSVWEDILTDFQYELPGSGLPKLKIDLQLCTKPNDVLLSMMEMSPFVNFVTNFQMEHGVELQFDKETEAFVIDYAKEHNLQVSATLNKLLIGSSALGFMNFKDPFKITLEMLKDDKYFDKLFTQWYAQQRKQE